MTQTKLISALNILHPEELKSLKKYMLMYTSSDSDQYKLFDILSKYHRNLDILPSKDVFKKSNFPHMSTKGFLNLNSRVYKILEEWLVWSEFKKDKDKSDILLVKTFNRRGQFQLADKTFSRALKRLANEKRQSLSKHENLHNLYRYHYFSENPVKFKQGKPFLEKLIEHYEKSHLSKSELFIGELINWGELMNYDFSNAIKMLTESIECIPNKDPQSVTKLILQLIKKKDEQSLEALINLIKKDEITPNTDLQVFVVLYLFEFSMKLLVKGELKNADYILEIFKYGFSNRIFTTLGQIISSNFLNYISVLVLTAKPKEVYQFIEEWSHLIFKADQEAAIAIAKCYVKREENKFDDIIVLLRDIRFSNNNLTMVGLAFQIKALYKLNQFDLAQNSINNFKRRLRNSKSTMGKQLYFGRLNFLKVMELLIINEYKAAPIDFSKYQYIHHKIWLSKQIKS